MVDNLSRAEKVTSEKNESTNFQELDDKLVSVTYYYYRHQPYHA